MKQGSGAGIALGVLTATTILFGVLAYLAYVDATNMSNLLKTAQPGVIAGKWENKNIANLNQRVNTAEEDLKKAQSALEQAAAAIRLKDQTLGDLNAQFNDLKNKAMQLTNVTLKAKDEEIDILKNKNEELQNIISSPDEALAIAKEEASQANLLSDKREEELRALRQSAIAVEDAHRRQLTDTNLNLSKLQGRLDELSLSTKASRDKREAAMFNGKVLEVDVERNFGIIDIGAAHRVKPGMQFEVRRWRQNKWDTIARVKINSVYPATSAFTILSEVRQERVCPKCGYKAEIDMHHCPFCRGGINNDEVIPLVGGKVVEVSGMNPLDPIVANDYIYNPLFSPDKSLTFTIAGESMSGFTREELEKLIINYGGNVTPEVGVKTDYLVLCNVPDEASASSPESFAATQAAIKAAEQYGVPIMRQVELLELIQE
ncbi:MAG: hypothetical protein JXA52_05565 [Planctomycetes bacterium]|nr:hypothetical protein [Planctomycetota bacterium]